MSGEPGAADATKPAPSTRIAVGFARALRREGLPIGLGSTAEFVRALDLLGLGSPSGVYWAGRATLLTAPEDLELYDRLFQAFFSGEAPPAPEIPLPLRERRIPRAVDEADRQPAVAPAGEPALAQYSSEELLRTRDFASLSEEEHAEALKLLGEIRLSSLQRTTRRLGSSATHTRRPDLHRAVHRAVRLDGELRIERYLEPKTTARDVLLLIDVSGSMEPYARPLLRFAQVAVASRLPVEVFTLGTRLTRVTRYLAAVDPDEALRASVAAIPDLAGGTRLGEGLAAFNTGFGVRGLARGASVVICSDGIDRGDPARLGEELARLQRVAYQIIWVNPLRDSPGYAPIARGMAAALEHVDAFVSGHSVRALSDLARTLGSRRASEQPRPDRRLRARSA